MPSSSTSDDQRFLELLQRWHSGDFTRQDEQALRSLAGSDDFRREALEGLMALPEENHANRLAVLQSRLQQATSQPRTRRVALPQIMAIAAALLVLIAAIWFFPRSMEKSAAPIAQTTENAPANNKSEAEAPAPESSSAADAVAQTTPRSQSAPLGESSGKTAKQRASSARSASAADERVVAAESKDEQMAAMPVQTPATTSPSAPSIFSGPPASQPGAAAAKAKQMPAKKPAPVAADSTQLAWNASEKKSDLDRLRREVQADKASPAESEPVDGWPAFNDYLRQNARLSPDARDHNISGSVRLKFSVNANGEAQNFVVLHSLGYGCDEEAKRLVQNRSWVRGQQPEVTVEVKFVR